MAILPFFNTDTSKSLGGAITSLGGAVSDFFNAGAQSQSADLYAGARNEALNQEELAREEGRLRSYAASREIESTLGAQKAAVAASGFEESGTALDLLRDSTQQGALTQSVITVQTAAEVSKYDAEAQAAQAQRVAAAGAGIGSIFGGIFKAASGIASLVGMF